MGPNVNEIMLAAIVLEYTPTKVYRLIYHFFHSFDNHVLIASSVWHTVLNTRNTAENRTGENHGAYVLVEIHTGMI